MSRGTVVVELDPDVAGEELRGALVADGFSSHANPGARWAFRGEGVVVSLYASGKCVVHGGGAHEFADRYLEGRTGPGLEALEDDVVTKWVGEYDPKYTLLDTDNPMTFGPLDLQDYYFEHKRQQMEAMRETPGVVRKIGKLYGELAGRSYDLIEEYQLDDAEFVVVALGSTCGTAKVVIDELRAKGMAAGLLKIRAFRPFPEAEIAEALKSAKAIAVLDRSVSFGAPGGPVHKEIKAALFGTGSSAGLVNYIYGLGGRDISMEHIHEVFAHLETIAGEGTPADAIRFLGLRE